MKIKIKLNKKIYIYIYLFIYVYLIYQNIFKSRTRLCVGVQTSFP